MVSELGTNDCLVGAVDCRLSLMPTPDCRLFIDANNRCWKPYIWWRWWCVTLAVVTVRCSLDDDSSVMPLMMVLWWRLHMEMAHILDSPLHGWWWSLMMYGWWWWSPCWRWSHLFFMTGWWWWLMEPLWRWLEAMMLVCCLVMVVPGWYSPWWWCWALAFVEDPLIFFPFHLFTSSTLAPSLIPCSFIPLPNLPLR